MVTANVDSVAAVAGFPYFSAAET